MKQINIDLSRRFLKGYLWRVLNMNLSQFITYTKRKKEIYIRAVLGQTNVFSITCVKNSRKQVLCTALDSGNTICFQFTLENTDHIGNEMHLTKLERCDVERMARMYQKSMTRFLLECVDKLANMFAINRIYLQDDARPKEDPLIDFSLMTVMQEGNTLYEKYGYKICDKQIPIDFELQKRHLRNFDFALFLYLLKKEDKKYVTNIMKRIEKNIRVLHELYTCVDIDAILYLQKILMDKRYPWSAMVNVLQACKGCMEKYID